MRPIPTAWQVQLLILVGVCVLASAHSPRMTGHQVGWRELRQRGGVGGGQFGVVNANNLA